MRLLKKKPCIIGVDILLRYGGQQHKHSHLDPREGLGQPGKGHLGGLRAPPHGANRRAEQQGEEAHRGHPEAAGEYNTTLRVRQDIRSSQMGERC